MDIGVYFDGQLIYTSIELSYKGKTKIIDRLVVDTGATKSFISVDAVKDIKLTFEDEDYIVTTYGIGGFDNSFRKTVDWVEFGSQKYMEFPVDFGVFYDDYGINGLIGLDLLRQAGVMLDLKDMRMFKVN